MRKLWYMGLEPYKARYTLQLQEWNRSVFERRGIDYEIVPGETLSNDQAIVTGQVLDAHGRTFFGMSQLMNLVRRMKAGEVTSEDIIYFEDMFQPGIESLPYILDQVPSNMRPRIAVRCLAQTIDPVMHMKVAGWKGKVYNISGLAFGKAEVRGRVPGELKKFEDRAYRVGFAARWDQEKQPDFYMDLIEEYHKLQALPYNNWPKVEFCVFSGSKLRSNNSSYMERTRRLQAEGKLTVYEDLEKNDYYALLNDTRVLFNCALQDWVSNTASEADALGANILYPAYRSFPEAFANDSERLYVPWSLRDAIQKLVPLLQHPHNNMGKFSAWNDGTIDRICDIFQGNGEQWLRMSTDYRRHTHESKY